MCLFFAILGGLWKRKLKEKKKTDPMLTGYSSGASFRWHLRGIKNNGKSGRLKTSQSQSE